MPKGFAARPQKKHHLTLVFHLLIPALALLSLVILQLHRGGFWVYTSLACVGSAVLCASLGAFMPTVKKQLPFRHRLMCWLGFLAAIYIDMLSLQYGVTSNVQAGLFALVLLAITLFFLGIITDLALTLSGITIALMVAATIVLHAYLLFSIMAIALVMGFFIFLVTQKRLQNENQ